MRLVVEARRRGGTGLSSDAGSPLAAARHDPRCCRSPGRADATCRAPGSGDSPHRDGSSHHACPEREQARGRAMARRATASRLAVN